MKFINVGSTLKVSFPGFNIHQSTNPHYQKSVKHISCAIISNIKFNSSVKENALHIIFIQDLWFNVSICYGYIDQGSTYVRELLKLVLSFSHLLVTKEKMYIFQ